MTLVPVPAMIERARREGYAVGYFESWSLDSLQGVVDAAEQTRSPVILGFNGAFLSAARPVDERLALYGAWAARPRNRPRSRAASFSMSVRTTTGSWPRSWRASTWSCSPTRKRLWPNTASAWPPSRRSRTVAASPSRPSSASSRGAADAGNGNGNAPAGGCLTDPAAAAEFVEATGIDLLAVSVGNVHIQTRGQTGLDLALLDEIRRRVAIPLVLHGGSGISAPFLRRAIGAGSPRSISARISKSTISTPCATPCRSTCPTRIGYWAKAVPKTPC